MPVALTTGQEVGLGVVAAIFIGFALVSSFLMPRRDPSFPGRWMRWFVLACIVLFLAMITAVLVFAREGEAEGEAQGAGEPAATQTVPGPAQEEEEDAANQGDPQAGAGVFESAGCGGCHTLEAAGSNGTVGPNLDEAKPELSLVVDRVTNGQGAMPAFGDQLEDKQIRDVASYVVASTGGG